MAHGVVIVIIPVPKDLVRFFLFKRAAVSLVFVFGALVSCAWIVICDCE